MIANMMRKVHFTKVLDSVGLIEKKQLGEQKQSTKPSLIVNIATIVRKSIKNTSVNAGAA